MDFEHLAQRASDFISQSVAQPLTRFFLSLDQNDWIVLISLLVGAIVTGYTLGRTRADPATGFSLATRYQNIGEEIVSREILVNFRWPDYHLMNHVTLQMDDGTTQIDHILISRFGIFVIETKHYSGWIFADAKQKNWTQTFFASKFRFQNPLHQNMRHVQAVQDLLDFLPTNTIKAIVVFTGEAKFKTTVPQGVFNTAEMIDYLHNQTDEILSVDQLQHCVGRLETTRMAISGTTDVEHIQSLEQRHRPVR